MKDINKNSIDELLVRYLAGSADENEKLEVENWLKAKNENQKHFNELKKIWQTSPGLKQYEAIDTESSLSCVKKRIDFNETPVRKLSPLWIAVRVAAVLVLFISMYWILSNRDGGFTEMQMVKVESSESIKELILPDGSVVTLNRFSSVEYPEEFKGDERRIQFKGEAYFEIEPDKSKPFIIETEKSETRVVGTAFNLKALDEEKEVSIVVTEGIVEFSGKTETTKSPVTLNKGEVALLSKKIEKNKNTDPNFMAWKTRILLFNNHKLVDILPVLSEFYNVEFKMENKSFGAYEISGRYNNLNIEEFIEILEMVLDNKVVIEPDAEKTTYWIKTKK